MTLAKYSPQHFLLAVTDGVATVTLNRPGRKNPLAFESHRELADFFRAASFDDEVKAVVVTALAAISPPAVMCSKSLVRWTSRA